MKGPPSPSAALSLFLIACPFPPTHPSHTLNRTCARSSAATPTPVSRSRSPSCAACTPSTPPAWRSCAPTSSEPAWVLPRGQRMRRGCPCPAKLCGQAARRAKVALRSPCKTGDGPSHHRSSPPCPAAPPRLPCRDWVLGATASHPMLQIANWDPLRPLSELIGQIKTFLEVRLPAGGRLRLHCPSLTCSPPAHTSSSSSSSCMPWACTQQLSSSAPPPPSHPHLTPLHPPPLRAGQCARGPCVPTQ